MFTVSSTDFKDNDLLSTLHGAGDDGPRPCGGKNVSPQIGWSNPPPGTKSYALVMHDVDGRGGLGVSHWIIYGIPPHITALPQGAGTPEPTQWVGGVNNRGHGRYYGPCPHEGRAPNHYVFSVYALDLAPDALPGGLNRDALLAQLEGHVLIASSIVGRYQR